MAIGGSWEDWFGRGAGGVAYVGSFTWGVGHAHVRVQREPRRRRKKYVAEAASHEIGHTLGLNHDGTGSAGYYTGHGAGPTGWAPVMGVGYYKALTQWSRGEYGGADNGEDDLAVITGRNGFGYRADDHGRGFAAAADLAFSGGAAARSFAASGIVERNADVDAFRFATTGGAFAVRADIAGRGANLDVKLVLRNAGGTVVAAANPSGQVWADLHATLAAGEYVLEVSGAGDGDPAAGGYSDYGSLGAYRLNGSVAGGSAVSGRSGGAGGVNGGGVGGGGSTDGGGSGRDSNGGGNSNDRDGRDEPRERNAGIVVRGPRLLRVSERGTKRRFRVRLADRPESRVAIRVRVGDRTEGRVRVRKLVFTPRNWNRNQTVVLKGEDDRGRDGTQYFQVELHAARSRDAAYRGLDAEDVWARNKDDDGRRRRGRRIPPPAAVAAFAVPSARPADFAAAGAALGPAARPEAPSVRRAAPVPSDGEPARKTGAGDAGGGGGANPRAAFGAAFLGGWTTLESAFGLPA